MKDDPGMTYTCKAADCPGNHRNPREVCSAPIAKGEKPVLRSAGEKPGFFRGAKVRSR